MRIFKSKPTLSELQEEDEYKSVQLSVARKNAMIAELEGKGKHWQDFSDNKKKSGINWSRIWAWLKSH